MTKNLRALVEKFAAECAAKREVLAEQMLEDGVAAEEFYIWDRTWFDEEKCTMNYECSMRPIIKY